MDEGAALALSYAAYDAVGYENGEAKVGPLKLGRFVKAVGADFAGQPTSWA